MCAYFRLRMFNYLFLSGGLFSELVELNGGKQSETSYVEEWETEKG